MRKALRSRALRVFFRILPITSSPIASACTSHGQPSGAAYAEPDRKVSSVCFGGQALREGRICREGKWKEGMSGGSLGSRERQRRGGRSREGPFGGKEEGLFGAEILREVM